MYSFKISRVKIYTIFYYPDFNFDKRLLDFGRTYVFFLTI